MSILFQYRRVSTLCKSLHNQQGSTQTSSSIILSRIKGSVNLTGCQTYLTEILWSGRLPIFAIFGLTESTRFNGAVNKHPFKFMPHGLTSLTLKMDHDGLIYKSIPVQYDSNLFQLAYDTLSDAGGENSPGNSISRDDYKNGFTFYVFHLLPVPAGAEFQPQRMGTLKVNLTFTLCASGNPTFLY